MRLRLEELQVEADGKRLDRELNELLQELRVAQGGILILVGFLLVIPFSPRFEDVTMFQRDIYYLTLLAAGLAAIVVMAPVSYHRLVFRMREKHTLIMRGHFMVILALFFLAVAILGVLILVTDLLFSLSFAIVMAAVYVGVVGLLWYALPLQSRRRAAAARRQPASES